MKLKVDTKAVFLAMAEKGLSGRGLAKLAGVSQQSVCKVLNGDSLGTNKTLPAICNVLGLNVKDIVEVVEE